MLDQLLDRVAWVGARHVVGPVRGLVLRFHGLGAQGMKTSGDPLDLEWASRGALVIEPFHGPWAWMNDGTRDLYDAVVDAVRARLALSAELPLIVTGGSMGGHGALTYAFRSRHRVTACQANCPVCDLPFHYTERPDLPRTMHHAFGSYGDIAAELVARSPLHQAARLPDIPYQIVHGVRDQAVGKARHSDPLVAAMRARGLRIEYIEADEMAHCGPLTWPIHRRMTDFTLEQLAR
jgi:dipeptidyl aminopeptidase/acylaminoacyl peptidase